MTRWRSFAADTDGAVAPTVALSLFALIGVGGLAFDYARLASVDTELQQAADQAALAAATQLDRQAGSTTRAVAAAQYMLANETRFANDGQGVAVATGMTDETDPDNPVGRVKFYSTKVDAEDDVNGYPASAAADLTAKFVQVAVTGRKAVYAMTPIVGALESGSINAKAAAGLGSAICKVPPVMMCNPAEPASNGNPAYPFDANALRGYGLRLVSVGNGPSAWAPGDFGYLNVGSSTANPNVELREALGWLTAPGDCSEIDGVQTRTGAGTTVTQALNTRFDIYERANTGNGNNASCPNGSSCPPSINVVKDVFQKGTPNAANKCGVANNEWEVPDDADAYRPTSATTDLTATQRAAVKLMGHPRDRCHAVSINGSCTYGGGAAGTRIGNGEWDRDAYFQANYGWDRGAWQSWLSTGEESARISASRMPTRYEVYNWEIANRGASIGSNTILASRPLPGGTGANRPTSFGSPVCSALQTPSSAGVEPGGSNVDRRRISAAVLNCRASNVHGGGPTVYPVLKWIELFLVEPSVNRGSGGNQRTDPNDIYVEIIGETTLGAGGSAGQVVRRDKPYLVR